MDTKVTEMTPTMKIVKELTIAFVAAILVHLILKNK